MRDALKVDRARVQVGRISRFGLLEMSRQRLRSSLGESSQLVCPRCDGQGTIRGIESSALSILRIVEEESMKEKTARIVAQVPVDVAAFLLNEKREILFDIEKRQNIKVLLIPNRDLETPHYTVQRIRDDETSEDASQSSYNLIDTTPDKSLEKMITQETRHTEKEEPVVKSVSPATPRPAPQSTQPGILVRLWRLFFGTDQAKKKKPVKKGQQRRNTGRNQNRRSGQQRRPGKAQQRKPAENKQKQQQKQTSAASDNKDNKDKQQDKSQAQSQARRGKRGGRRRGARNPSDNVTTNQNVQADQQTVKPESNKVKPAVNPVVNTTQDSSQSNTAPAVNKPASTPTQQQTAKPAEVKTEAPVFHETPKPQAPKPEVAKPAASSMTQIETKPVSSEVKPVEQKAAAPKTATDAPIAQPAQSIKETAPEIKKEAPATSPRVNNAELQQVFTKPDD